MMKMIDKNDDSDNIDDDDDDNDDDDDYNMYGSNFDDRMILVDDKND